MSGPITRVKKINRRQFIKQVSVTGVGVGALSFAVFNLKDWLSKSPSIEVVSHNLDSRGHLVRQHEPLAAEVSDSVEIAIIGAGISGLTAGYFLKKSGLQNFKILEMNTAAGGNSEYFQSTHGKASWGAHYLPIIRNDDALLKDFLVENQIITGEKNNLPIYNVGGAYK